MRFIKKTLVFFSVLILITVFSAVCSVAENEPAFEPDYENDPLYIKYLNQPMTMATTSGASKLVHKPAYANYDKVYGIDVSYFQNKIDWKQVKASGIDFAIVRLGYRGYGNGALALDERFLENVTNAKAAGIKVGLYFFTQALNTAEAQQEAEFVLKNIKGMKFEMPIYIDMEEIYFGNSRFDSAKLSYNAKTNICKTFCDTIKNAGYRAGVYASNGYFTYQINGPQLAKNYDIWMADYNRSSSYEGEYQIWQYTGTAQVDGISTPVDMNVLYMKKGPDKVTNLRADGYGDSVTLTWSKSQYAHGYAIYAKDLNTNKITEVTKTTATTKKVTVPFEKTRFYIKAYYNVGKKYAYSGYSTGVSCYQQQLPEVTGYAVSALGSDYVKLTWNKMTSCDGYIVYKYNNEKQKYERVAKTTDSNSVYKFTGLFPATEYNLTIRAYKTVDGKEVTSGYHTAFYATTKPSVVSDFKSSSTTSNSVTLAWKKDTNAQGYIVYRYYSAIQKWVRVTKTDKNIASYKVTGLNAGTVYKFAVKAYITVDGKELASPSYPTTTGYTRPETITGITSSSSDSSIKLSWKKATGVDGYILYQKISGNWKRIALPTLNTFTVKNLKAGTNYSFAIKGYRKVNGREVTSPKYVPYNTSTAPAVVDFTLTAGSKKATVKWSKVTGATGYKVYYKTSSDGKWIGLKTTDNKTTSFTKTGLTSGKTYYFTVKACRTVNGVTYNGKYIKKSVKIK